jgi:Glu-tRNA(Gln) amidotransferase subunit E-like FAD-binding protein
MIDYHKIELKSGIEIHQQLATNKLFCGCLSAIRQDEPHFKIIRELRPLAGELGRIDPAAIFERKKRKHYVYEGYNDTTCLVELDEEPPHPINEGALNIALLIARMLNCNFPDVVQVMRKTVIDGSNTSGFQRTALIGYDGFIKTSFGKVGIQTVILEEDAGRRTGETPESVTFRLDRLGIPLVEIATAPDCKTPEQVKETAETIGMLLRSTGKVIRGIGTIRQDVNISIKGHPRVELKGVQELQQMPKIVEFEAARQMEEVKSKGKNKLESHVRNVLPDMQTKFLRPMPGSARMYPETDLPVIELDKEMIAEMKLPDSPERIKYNLHKLKLSHDLVEQLANSEYLQMFLKFVDAYKDLNSNQIAITIIVTPKEVKRKLKLAEFEPSEDVFNAIFKTLADNQIVKESIPAILEDVAKETRELTPDVIDIIISRYKLLSELELKKEIERLKIRYEGPPEKLVGFAIGHLRGKADPQKIIKLLKK